MPKALALRTFVRSLPSPQGRRLLIIIAGLSLLAFSANSLLTRYQATHNPSPQLPETTVTHSTTTPDETPVKAKDFDTGPKVPANQPRQIILPTIGAQGYIQKIGLDQHQAVAVPTNIHVAGWFVGQTRPGEPGLSLIGGHVQGRYQPGIFKNLTKIKPGDTFRIELGDHSIRQFQVTRVSKLNLTDTAQQMLLQDKTITHQLNLITCGGNYDAKTKQYDQRVLVVSRLTESKNPIMSDH